MNVDEFRQSVASEMPPDNSTPVLQALWYEAKGEWTKAHEILQQQDNADGAWVHAYLHRVEGDAGNAAYWYRRAGKPVAQQSLADEWSALVAAFLTGS